MANKKRNPLEIYEKAIEDDYFFATAAADWEKPSIIIHGKDNKKILEITYEGEVIWHAEDAASEAAEEFCKSLSIGVEQKAGIRETRKQWQDSQKKSIKKALKNGELTTEKLDEIFYKHDFIGKLKGNDVV